MRDVILKTSAGEVLAQIDERIGKDYIYLDDNDINTLVGIADSGGGSGDGGGGAASAADLTLSLNPDIDFEDDGLAHEVSLSDLGMTEEQFQKACAGDYIRIEFGQGQYMTISMAAVSDGTPGSTSYFSFYFIETGEMLAFIYDPETEKYTYELTSIQWS